jgi:hypothetical protein
MSNIHSHEGVHAISFVVPDPVSPVKINNGGVNVKEGKPGKTGKSGARSAPPGS